MMKIAVLIFHYFSGGGIQIDMRAAAEQLAARGAQITVFCIASDAPAPEGCSVRCVPVTGKSNHVRARHFEEAMAEILGQEHFDAVLGFNRMKHLDCYFAGDDLLFHRWQNPLWNRLSGRRRSFLEQEKAVYAPGGTPLIFSLTHRQEADAGMIYRTDPKRFCRLGPGVSQAFRTLDRSEENRNAIRSELGVASDQILLVQAAASFRTKGVDRTLELVADMPLELQKKVQLFVAGSDRSHCACQNWADQRKLPIHFMGNIDNMPELLLAADLMVHPARAEATGGVLAEALACGCAVLTTDLCGYAPLVRQYASGIVLEEPYRKAEWQNVLNDFIRHPENIQACRKAAAELGDDDFWYNRHRTIAEKVLEFAAHKQGVSEV